MSYIRNRTLLNRLYQVQWSPLLILFLNADNKTIFENLEQQFESSKFKPKLPYLLNFANISEREMKQTKMAATTEY